MQQKHITEDLREAFVSNQFWKAFQWQVGSESAQRHWYFTNLIKFSGFDAIYDPCGYSLN